MVSAGWAGDNPPIPSRLATALLPRYLGRGDFQVTRRDGRGEVLPLFVRAFIGANPEHCRLRIVCLNCVQQVLAADDPDGPIAAYFAVMHNAAFTQRYALQYAAIT